MLLRQLNKNTTQNRANKSETLKPGNSHMSFLTGASNNAQIVGNGTMNRRSRRGCLPRTIRATC
eukprot:2365591-Amphidinium_carterae.1